MPTVESDCTCYLMVIYVMLLAGSSSADPSLFNISSGVILCSTAADIISSGRQFRCNDVPLTNCTSGKMENVELQNRLGMEVFLLQCTYVLETKHDPNTDDVAHSPACQGVSEGEASGVASLQTGVPGLKLQPGCGLPVGRWSQPEPSSKQHQARRSHHDLQKWETVDKDNQGSVA